MDNIYSRKFDSANIPPDYAGSILHNESMSNPTFNQSKEDRTYQKQCTQCENKKIKSCDIPKSSPRSEFYVPMQFEQNERFERGDCRNIPRRPVYKDECECHNYDDYCQDDYKETQREKCKSEERHIPKSKQEGRSWFSKMNFSLEDIVIAGLILMFLSEKQDCQIEKDNDLLLILGFLLVVGL